MRITQLTIVLLLVAVAAGCSKSASTTKSFPLGAPGSLSITFPATWKETDARVVERQTERTSTFDGLKFTPTNSERCEFLIELLPASAGISSNIDLKTFLRAQVPPQLSNTPPEILEVKGVEASGYYFRLTDPRTNIPASEFRYGTEGFARLGPVVLIFKMVNDDPASEPKGLDIIKSARITKP